MKISIIIIALLYSFSIVTIGAVTKTCETHFHSEHPTVLIDKDIINIQDVCKTECHDCVDHVICGDVLDDLQLIDPNNTYSITINTLIANISTICLINIQNQAQQIVKCTTGTSSCDNYCPTCHDLDVCIALKTSIHLTQTIEPTFPFIVDTVTSYILNACENVWTNTVNSRIPSVYVICLSHVIIFLLINYL
jgi:hypothetical protein